MKRLFILTISLSLVSAACTKPSEPPRRASRTSGSGAGASSIPLTTAEKQRRAQAKALGRDAALQLKKALGMRVIAAVRKGGLAAAIAACATEALPLTTKVQKALRAGMTIRRTSHKVRNPKNAPDAAESRVIRFYRDGLAKGQRPTPYLEFAMLGGKRGYRVYLPIMTNGMCVKCHGAKASLPPAVTAVLAKSYPKDQAVGFKAGELRGIFSVTIPASALVAKP